MTMQQNHVGSLYISIVGKLPGCPLLHPGMFSAQRGSTVAKYAVTIEH